jgi:hypothetical protein
MKVQLDDKWGRPSGLWSENGKLILDPIDLVAIKAESDARILAMNAGPMPQTLARKQREIDLRHKRLR